MSQVSFDIGKLVKITVLPIKTYKAIADWNNVPSLWGEGSPFASFPIGGHFDRNKVKGEISDSRKVWNFRLH